MFDEFLETHVEDKKIWELKNKLLSEKKTDSDDDDDDNDEEETSGDEDDSNNIKKEENLANKNISDKEYMELIKNKSKSAVTNATADTGKSHGPNTFFTVKLKGLAYKHKKKDVKNFFKGIKPKSIRIPQKINGLAGIAYVGFKTEKQLKQALQKNKSILGKY